MFEDENQQNTYETEKFNNSVKDALTSNSAVKAAIFVIGLMVCIIVIYALIFAGRTSGSEGSSTPTPKPGSNSSATVDPNSTPGPDATLETTPTPTPTQEPFSFKKNDVNPKIKELQQLLINKGYLNAETELSETFGARTEEAVKLFQSENGLEDTGVVDNALWAAIEAAPVRDTSELFTLKKGDTDAKVKELQQLLMDKGYMEKDEPTDYFGSKTEAAVKLFQKQNNLAENGIVNNAVFNKLKNAEVYTGTLP